MFTLVLSQIFLSVHVTVINFVILNEGRYITQLQCSEFKRYKTITFSASAYTN
jgi:hypothetical protein